MAQLSKYFFLVHFIWFFFKILFLGHVFENLDGSTASNLPRGADLEPDSRTGPAQSPLKSQTKSLVTKTFLCTEPLFIDENAYIEMSSKRFQISFHTKSPGLLSKGQFTFLGGNRHFSVPEYTY